MKRFKFVTALLLGVMLAGAASSAASAQDDPYVATTTTTEAGIPVVTVVRGETIDISGSGCAPGATVSVVFDDGTRLGSFAAGAGGDFVSTVVIPSNATLGEHLLTATCGNVEQYLRVNVLAKHVTQGSLARTGSSSTGPLVGIGAAAVVLGAAFVYGARRPRHA